MSFSEFYQRSINEPEQFWAEQARRIDWQTPFTQTLDHSNPPFARWFCEGRLFGNRRRVHLYLPPVT